MSVILVLAVGLMACLSKVTKAAETGTAFTYQGRLIDDNVAADGEYDFQFRLFGSDTVGSQVGDNVNIDDVNVIDGYFTVELDFGNVFTGELLWLEIAVREGDSTGDFMTLSPRQKITAVPYAMTANTTVNGGRIVSGNLEGVCHNPNDAGAPEDTLPSHPFEFDISELGAVEPNNIGVSLTGFKMSSSSEVEGELWFDWEVTTYPYPLTLRINVWDENHNPYDFTDGINWEDKRLKLSYIVSVASGGMSAGGNVLSGKFEYTVNDTPTMPFEIPISVFDVDDINSINVVASGIRNETGGIAAPLAVKSTLVDSSGLKLNLWVWDINGDEPDDNNPAWDGKILEVSYAIIRPAGGGTTAARCDFEDISGQVSAVLGGLVDSSWPNVNPVFEFVDSEGKLGIFLTDQAVNEKVNVNVMGWKEDGMGNKVEPLEVRFIAESNGTNVKVRVWAYDLSGTAYTRGDFLGDTLKVRITCYKTAPAADP